MRIENKAKEHSKLLADGQVPPDMSVLPSIETESRSSPSKGSAGPAKEITDQTSAAAAEPVRRASPKSKRVGRSLSPFKPESEYTEEELKKPTETYVRILDDVLKEHPTGVADLQDIYHAVAKRYPYFEYRVNTKGWQSSVRHNLLQNDRFMEVGKSGKGRYWRLNPDVSVEKEKKRKITPPMRPPMQNGQYMQQPPPHFGQPQYGNPYAPANGQAQSNTGPQPGSSTYYSPYAQPGSNFGHGAHGQSGAPSQQTRAYPSQHSQQPRSQSSAQGPSRQPPPVHPSLRSLVDDIMAYRVQYLNAFVNTPEYPVKETLFQRVTTYLSDLYGDGKNKEGGVPPSTDEEKMVAASLDVFFRRNYSAEKRAEADPNSKDETSGSVQQTVNQAVDATVQQGDGANALPPVGPTNATAEVTPPPHTAVPTTALDAPAPVPSTNGSGDGAEHEQQGTTNTASSGMKRAAEETVEEPDAKRVKEE